MSWQDFQKHMHGKSKNNKRRRLFHHTLDVENNPSHADFVHTADHDCIASFDSDSESNSPKKRKSSKKICFNELKNEGSTSFGNISPKTLEEVSPIDSFGSDSSTDTSENTPPIEKKGSNLQSDTHCTGIVNDFKQSFLDQTKDKSCKNHLFGKTSLKKIKIGVETVETSFNSSFSHFEETLKLNPSEDHTSTKQSAASWLDRIKSPETKLLPHEDKSAKKLLAKKHPVGSLAQKAQSMNRFNKGEYLMWLHKNISLSSAPPFNESCYYGLVQSTSMDMKYKMICISTVSLETSASKNKVVVLLPSDMKYGKFKNGEIIVVFPEFHCFVKKSTCMILALFHAQFFLRNQYNFDNFSKIDHFLGVTEIINTEEELLHDKVKSIIEDVPASVSRNISSSHLLVDVRVCVYHLQIKGYFVQILGCDKDENLIIAEIPVQTAKPVWDQIALSLGVTCLLTSLKQCHVSLAFKCSAWFPQIEMFSINYKQQLYCFEQHSGSIKLLDDNIVYIEKLLSHQNRTGLTCRYLGTVSNINERHLTFVMSVFGTLQWIEHENILTITPGTCLKFVFIKSISPMHYEFDNLSMVLVCLNSDKTFNITFPNLYTCEDESESAVCYNATPNIPSYNQYLPKYTPCSVSLTIDSVIYKNRKFYVSGSCCGVIVDVIVTPSSVRSLLGTSCIAECDLDRLKGALFECKGVLINKRVIAEYQLDFLNI